MKSIKLIILSLLLCTLSAFPEATGNGLMSEVTLIVMAKSDSVALDNKYFRVMQNSAACTEANTPGFGSRVIVALADISFNSSNGAKNLKRGAIAVFQASGSYDLPKGEYFEVAFKLNHPPLKSPEEWLEPLKNTIIFEDEQFRIFEEKLAPGDDRELHSHAQRLVVRLNDVQLTDPRFHETAKSSSSGRQVPNTVKFAEPVVHVVRNLSKDTQLFNIVIEFKVQH